MEPHLNEREPSDHHNDNAEGNEANRNTSNREDEREKVDDQVESGPAPSQCVGIGRRLGRRLEAQYLAFWEISLSSHPHSLGESGGTSGGGSSTSLVGGLIFPDYTAMSHVIWRDRVWFDPWPAPTPAAIQHIQDLVGARLPSSYLEYLSVAHGARLDYAVRLSPGGAHEDEAIFSDWYVAGEPDDASAGTLFDELSSFESAWFREHLPDRFLPIARTGAEDDTLLFDLTDRGHGTVLAWMSGLPAWTGRRPENVIHSVAATFEDLISKLYISDELFELSWPPGPSATADGIADLEAWLDHGRPGWRGER